MRSIWFIRHAQSEGNVGLPSIDVHTIGLTELGHQQAQYVAHAFDRQPDLLVTSPYTRTKLTAQPTIERFPSVVQEEWAIQEFTYLAVARCVNTTIKQRKRWQMSIGGAAIPSILTARAQNVLPI